MKIDFYGQAATNETLSHSVCPLTHSEGLRTGMLADVTNNRLSDILLHHTHTHTHASTHTAAHKQTHSVTHRFTGKTKPPVRVNGALTPRPRPSVASSKGR